MRLTSLSLLYLFFCFVLKSQEIDKRNREKKDMNTFFQVLNLENQKAIEGVYIHDKQNYTLSDSLGYFKIEGFSNTDSLFFQHINYELRVIAFKDLKTPVFLKALPTQLEDITVLGDKWHLLEEAQTQEQITLNFKNITFQQNQTSADLLASTGEISLQKSQQGGGSPMLRGFAANRVLLVLDGIRLNNAIYRSGNLQNIISVDAQSLEKVDILFGAASLLYGSDALGGALVFETFRPRFLGEDKTKLLTGKSFLRYTNNNHEQTGHLSFNFASPKLSTFTSLTWSTFKDLRAGKKRINGSADFGKNLFYVDRINGLDSIIFNPNPERQLFSGYSQWNILQKINLQIYKRLNLIYTFHYTSSSNIPRYDQLTRLRADLPRSATWFYGPQKWFLHQLSFFHQTEKRLIDNLQLIFAYQRLDEDRFDRRFQSNNLRKRFEDVDILSLNLTINKLFNQKHHIFYGLEAIYNKVRSQAFLENINTQFLSPTLSRYPNGGSKYYNFGAFLNYKWQINNSAFLNAGLRYNHILLYSIFNQNDLPFDNFDINTGAWSTGIQYVFSPNNWLLKTGFSTAFRAPNLDDVAKVFESGEGIVVVPNPDLASEYTYQLELSIKKKWNKKLTFNLVGFYNWLENIAVRRNFSFQGQDSIFFDGELSQVQSVINAGSGYIWGLNAKLEYTIFETLSLLSTFTYLKGLEHESQTNLRHVAPPFGKTVLTFDKSWIRLAIIAQYSRGIDFKNLALSEQNKPYLYDHEGALPWWILNFKAEMTFVHSWKILLYLENLFDQHYRTYSSGISGGGRSFSITLYKDF